MCSFMAATSASNFVFRHANKSSSGASRSASFFASARKRNTFLYFLLSSLDKAVSKTVDFAGKAAESTRDAAEKAAGATRDFAEKAADKAKAGARIAKLNVEISAEKDNMKKTFIEIGKLYYDTHKEEPEGFFIQLCEEVALAQKNIADKEAEIESLKSKSDDCVDIEVEFEEIVAEEEAAAEASEDTTEE